MTRFSDKNVLITGGSSGIGISTAELFQKEGAHVAITGRTNDTLESARAKLGDKALILKSDTAKLDEIGAAIDKVKSAFGSLDVLFINAGIAKFAPFDQSNEALFDETFDINVKGAFFTIQRALPILKNGAAIVLNTSVVDTKGFANTSIYSASKAALRSLARTLATELLPRNIRVNTVAPGPIETPIYNKLGLSSEQLEGFSAVMRDMNPMKRFGQPEEVAKVALFLASSDASYITGQQIYVDGGVSQL